MMMNCFDVIFTHYMISNALCKFLFYIISKFIS